MFPFSYKNHQGCYIYQIVILLRERYANICHHHAYICTSELIPSTHSTNGKTQGNTLHSKYGVPPTVFSLALGDKYWYCFVDLQYQCLHQKPKGQKSLQSELTSQKKSKTWGAFLKDTKIHDLEWVAMRARGKVASLMRMPGAQLDVCSYISPYLLTCR